MQNERPLTDDFMVTSQINVQQALGNLHRLKKALLDNEGDSFVFMHLDSVHAKLTGDEVCTDCPEAMSPGNHLADDQEIDALAIRLGDAFRSSEDEWVLKKAAAISFALGARISADPPAP